MTNFFASLKGVMYRKLLMYKRSWCGLITTILITVVLSITSILISLLVNVSSEDNIFAMFSSVTSYSNASIVQVINKDFDPEINQELSNSIINEFKSIWKSEVGKESLSILTCDNWTKLFNYTEKYLTSPNSNSNIIFAFSITNESEINKKGSKYTGNVDFYYYYNTSYYESYDNSLYAGISKAVMKVASGVDLKLKVKEHWIPTEDAFYESNQFLSNLLSPVFIAIGVSIICSFFIGFIIDDIKSPKRPYMVNYGLSLSAYWVGNFIIDYIFMVLASIIVLIIYSIANIGFIKHFNGAAMYFFFVIPLSSIMFAYVLCWLFSKKTIGTTVYTIIVVAFALLPLISLIPSSKLTRKGLSILEGFFPPSMYYGAFNYLTTGVDMQGKVKTKLSLKTFFNDKGYKPLGLMMYFSVFIYGFILAAIEYIRIELSKKLSETGWELNKTLFMDIKSRQPITEEAREMEREVASATTDRFAVRINDVSKLFRDSNGNPLCAVNQVSLGIKRGELFGFLGANGAGKTTLMKMILREMPISNGNIEIDGHDIAHGFDSTQLAICPQFDDHLTPQLTPYENLKYFSLICNIPSQLREIRINELIGKVLLDEHKEKLINELSGGNQRKTAVAVSFLSNAGIVLLDEPTSSLDPIARKAVHDLINEYRGTKTFMLCTHLLDEAETLCDNISIMLNGCVYVIGSPQYLSSKFGTEWKVDLTLENSYSSTQEACDIFIGTNCPQAKLSIRRPLSRIYSIPSAAIKLNDLFRLFQNAKNNHLGGIKYYTCSMSTLEKVFLEIVLLSEKQKEIEEDEMPQFETKP